MFNASVKTLIHSNIVELWKLAWKERAFKIQFTITVLASYITLSMFTKFLVYVEQRPGIILPDPVLNIFPAQDVTWITFSLIYSGIIIGLYYLGQRPSQLLLAFQAYTLLVIFRIIAMYLIPLDPPPGMIILHDPLVESFGTSATPTKDLFFSGHTSIMFLLFLTAANRNLKFFFLICTLLVGFCVILQQVHYSIDVWAAPFFAYSSYRVIILLHRWFHRQFPTLFSAYF